MGVSGARPTPLRTVLAWRATTFRDGNASERMTDDRRAARVLHAASGCRDRRRAIPRGARAGARRRGERVRVGVGRSASLRPRRGRIAVPVPVPRRRGRADAAHRARHRHRDPPPRRAGAGGGGRRRRRRFERGPGAARHRDGRNPVVVRRVRAFLRRSARDPGRTRGGAARRVRRARHPEHRLASEPRRTAPGRAVLAGDLLGRGWPPRGTRGRRPAAVPHAAA